MTSNVILLSRDPLPDGDLAELASWPGPGWIIEPRSGQVLAANAAGLARLALAEDGGNARLDGAMPALLRLREIARRTPPGKTMGGERLVFWTASQSLALTCDVRRLGADGLLVVLERGLDAGEARGSGEERLPSLRAAGDDAATLREIAHRIREGQHRLAQARDRSAASPAVRDEMPRLRGGAEACAKVFEKEGKAEHAGNDGERNGLPDLVPELAHELKTPLSAIAAAAEIMRDQRFGPLRHARYRGYAADIHEAARHALAVIDRMLGKEGTVSADSAAIDLNGIARRSVSEMKLLAGRKGVRLSLSLAERMPSLVADAVGVRQIVLNLLTNAVKFTPTGGRVTVLTRRRREGPIEIEVRDTGAGMTKAEIARLHSAPHRSRLAPRRGGGFGLGLPLVRALAAENGATFAIRSTPGKGTRATIAFARDLIVPARSRPARASPHTTRTRS